MGGPRPERFRTEPRPSTTLWVRPDRSRRSTSRSRGGKPGLEVRARTSRCVRLLPKAPASRPLVTYL